MIRNISIIQLRQLSDEQRNKLNNIWKPKILDMIVVNNNQAYIKHIDIIEGQEHLTYDGNKITLKKNAMPLLSISQMIEILRKLKYDFSGDWGSILLHQDVRNCLWECLLYLL